MWQMATKLKIWMISRFFGLCWHLYRWFVVSGGLRWGDWLGVWGQKSGTKVGSSAKVQLPPSCCCCCHRRCCRPQSKLPKPPASWKATIYRRKKTKMSKFSSRFQAAQVSSFYVLFLFQTLSLEQLWWTQIWQKGNPSFPHFLSLFWWLTSLYEVRRSITEAAIPGISHGWHCTQGSRIPLLRRSLQMHLQTISAAGYIRMGPSWPLVERAEQVSAFVTSWFHYV